MLTEEEKRTLLGIARRSIRQAMESRTHPPALKPTGGAVSAGLEKPELTSGRLRESAGAFVTIRIKRDLRGCIGYIESALPLATAVAEVAEKAAFEDPRFPPLTPDEEEHMRLEVSVLSPLQPMANVGDITVGVHGLLLELGRHRGLLLPQVAVEYGWDRTRFLESTARKAGLPPEAWQDPGAKIYLFSAEVIKEERDE